MTYKLLAGVLLAVPLASFGQSPLPTYMSVFQEVSEALANRDADAFLDQVDPHMPDYEKLRDEMRDMTATSQEIGSTIDVIIDDGDDQKRSLDLDWLLKIDNEDPRRRIVHCQIQKQGKKWKITRLEPVEFFRK